MQIRIPKKVDELSIDLHPRLRDRLHAITSQLFLFQLTFWDTDCQRRYKFPVDSQWLATKYNRLKVNKKAYYYSWFIDWLLEHKIIETDGSYQSKVSYTMYKFVEWEETTYVECKDKRLKHRVPVAPKITSDQLLLEYILDCTRKITVDYEQAEELKNEVYIDDPRREDKLWLVSKCLSKIGTNEMTFTNSNKVKRLFTTIGYLKKEFRCCLRMDGERMLNIDIKNSQPAIFAHICMPEFRENFQELLEENLGKGFKYPDEQESDDFIKSTANGTYYEDLAAFMGVSRKEAKSANNEYFFGPANRDCGPAKYLEERYPEVNNLMKRIKEKNKSWGYKSYKLFAQILQKIEVNVVLGKIGTELKSRNIEFITIHDSVMIKRSRCEESIKVVKDVLSNNGMMLKIEIEE